MHKFMRLGISLSAVFVVSGALFMYEVILTRIFSAIMTYHFVFIVASVAILGLGLGAMDIYKKVKEFPQTDGQQIWDIGIRSVVYLGFTLPLLTLFFYKLPFQPLNFFVYIALAVLPFVLGGRFLSCSFSVLSKYSYLLYFGDLVGAGLAAFGVVTLLNTVNLIRLTVYLGEAILLISLLLNLAIIKKRSRRKVLAALGGVALLAVLAVSPLPEVLARDFSAYRGIPKMIGLLKLNGEQPVVEYSSWDAFARTDVVATKDPNEKLVLIDGGAAAPMVRFDGNLAGVQQLKKEAGYLAFVPEKPRRVLVIGSGGGIDILLARLGGSEDITAVEINPGSVAAARKFSDYNGSIYDLPEVRTFIQNGRTFIDTTSEQFDVIYLSKVMTQAAEGTGYALSENYIYTREAIRSYLNHLTPGGRLAFVLHGPDDLSKALATVMAVLKESGVADEEIARQVLIAGTPAEHHDQEVNYPLLLVKKTPFAPDELAAITARLKEAQLQLEQLLHYGKVGKTAATVVTDDRPFFYNVDNTIPFELYILLALVLHLGWRWLKHATDGTVKNKKSLLLYFGALGVGFMLLEIALVQKFVLILGHPTLAFTVVAATLLIGGGLGSLLGQVAAVQRVLMRRRWLPAFLVAVLAILTGVAVPWIFSTGAALANSKTILTVFTLFPLSVTLGLPFPTGLRALREEGREDFVPLAWGINGWFSVIGSIIAMMVAITAGFRMVLFAGVIIYALLAYRCRRGLVGL